MAIGWTGIGFVSHNWGFHRSAAAEIGFVSHFRHVRLLKLGSFRINVGCRGTLGMREGAPAERPGLNAGGPPGAGDDSFWARFVTPPVFGVAMSAITERIIPESPQKVKVFSGFSRFF